MPSKQHDIAGNASAVPCAARRCLSILTPMAGLCRADRDLPHTTRGLVLRANAAESA